MPYKYWDFSAFCLPDYTIFVPAKSTQKNTATCDLFNANPVFAQVFPFKVDNCTNVLRLLTFTGMFLIWVLSFPPIQLQPSLLKAIGPTWDNVLSDAYSSGGDSKAKRLHLCWAVRTISIGKTWEKIQIFYIEIFFHYQCTWTTCSQSASGTQTSNSDSSLPADSCSDIRP